MNIPFRQLEIFERVAVCGHVTKASEQLFITQSAVSMAVAGLEKFAGAPLFERRGKKLLLNDRGRLILVTVQEVLRQVATIEQLLTESVGEPIGVLKVGASTTIGNYLLPALIARLSERHPRARALLQVGNTAQIAEAVENGNLDMGIIEGPSHVRSLNAAVWRDDELVVIAGRNHAWAGARKASKAMLAEAPWIMREKGSGTREVFEAAMNRKKITWTAAMELGHTEAIKKAVEANLGVSCLSRMAVARELSHKWLVEVETPLDLGRSLIILTRDGEYRTALLTAFLAILEKSR
ncbi:MAG: LysR family transcriptional regulator [Deltaproteobacteria bacterium]|nr:LysR family transcriptional regulator [Deltaproteobacteria bacterium]